MASIVASWNALETNKKVVAALGAVALVTVLAVLVRMATQPSLTLLYSGLESQQAGEVVGALEQQGISYEVRGGSIFVPAQDRDSLRMTLASEGLPRNNSRGYELLDSLSGFGTTSQMFDAAYTRATEGELARTITASPQISMARVHIAQSNSSVFSNSNQSSASVFITPVGEGLTAGQARALRFLVASAVAGLAPDSVSIIDNYGNLLGTSDTADAAGTDTLHLELKERVERLLTARVGQGNAIVEVSVEKILQREAITERVFDPENRVAVSTDSQERTDSSEDSGSGGVTVASNVPDGDGSASENSKSQGSETRERINYEVSETQREIVKAPGAIKRLSVAVLVNGSAGESAGGTILPRPEDELRQLTALVKSAVGYDEARGDVITVESMIFSPTVPEGTGPIDQPLINTSLDLMTIIQMAILAIVGLVIALAVVRPLLSARADDATLALAPPNLDESQLDFATTDLPGQEGNEMGIGFPDSGLMALDSPMDSGFGVGGVGDFGAVDDNPVQKLRDMIETRQEETVEILRQWLDEKEKQGVGS